MNLPERIIIILVAGISVVLLVLGAMPGVLTDVMFYGLFIAFLVVPVVVAAAIIKLFFQWRRGQIKTYHFPRRLALIVGVIVLVTGALLVCFVPVRIGFAFSQTAFEQQVSKAKVSEYGGESFNQRLGVYRVDEIAADSRGGVCFRVYNSITGFGPDQMSYGFVYQPNREGTPFGAAHYDISALGDGWYCFGVSDDWF